MDTAQISPSLTFNGNCEEAMNFYKNIFGGELYVTRFGDFADPNAPMHEEQKSKVMRATLINGALSFAANDAAPDRPVVFGDSVTMSLSGPNQIALSNTFNQLAEGGAIGLSLTPQPWGDLLGMLTDKFGIHWVIIISALPQQEAPATQPPTFTPIPPITPQPQRPQVIPPQTIRPSQPGSL